MTIVCEIKKNLDSAINGTPGGSVVKNLPANAGETGSIPGPRKMPWRREWQPTPVFLPGKSHRQRSLAGYSPWDCKRVRHDLVTKQQHGSFIDSDIQILFILIHFLPAESAKSEHYR